MKQKIENLIRQALKNLDIEAGNFSVEHPEDFKNGDYSTNIAFFYLRDIPKDKFPDNAKFNNPKEYAEKIIEELNKIKTNEIEKIDTAGVGFINFYLSREFFSNELAKIISLGEKYGASDIHKGKSILVEHSSPNLFKPFHIGHVMNNAIGESITRLAKFSGAKVKVISFPSDISLGIAKAIYKLEKDGFVDFIPDIKLLGDAYVDGTKLYDEDESTHQRIKEIADNLYNNIPSTELDIFNHCKEFNINYFEKITAKLGSHFDNYIYESKAGIKGKEIVLENTPNIFTKSEGAIVYIPEEEKKYINTAVFVNSQGNPTYEAKDLGLLDLKFEKYNPDLSIFITDHQQVSHFKVVLDSAEKIHKDWVEKSVHRTHGRMTFKGQKMSSRLGGVPLAEDLLNAILDDVKEKSADLDDAVKDEIAIAALKFSILRAQAGKNIDFDPETSLSFEGDSGPYLQYAGVRANSVLEKADMIPKAELKDGDREVSDVEKLLARFPEVVENSINAWAPHYLTTYLLQLAQSFNSWYAHTKIIDETNSDMPYNLAITKSVAQVMKNGLWLLGISLPERM